LEHAALAHVDLIALDHGRDGDDDRKLLGIAPEIVRHGEDGPVLVASQHDL
jgi:hypothetical protein